MQLRNLSFVGCLIFLLALGVTSPVFADGKVGVINIERVMRDSEPAKRAEKKLEKEFGQRDQDVEKLRTDIQRLQEDLVKNSVSLSDVQRKIKEKEIDALSLDYQRKRRSLNEDINLRRNEEYQLVIDKTNKIVPIIAAREGYDVILQEAAYVNPRVDITDAVIKILSETSVK